VSGTSSGWSDERKAAQSARMVRQNRDPAFVNLRRKGQGSWTPARRELQRATMLANNLNPEFHQKKRAGIAKRAPRGFSIPEHCHPCVRGLFVGMNEKAATRRRVSKKSGISEDALTGWRTTTMPQTDSLDAALGAVGLELAIVPKGSRDRNGFLKKARNVTTGEQR
jgi:hypothetical protein